MFACIIPTVDARNQLKSIVEIEAQCGQHSSPKVLIVRVFNQTPATPSDNRIAFHDHRITKSMYRINPCLGAFVERNFIGRISRGLVIRHI